MDKEHKFQPPGPFYGVPPGAGVGVGATPPRMKHDSTFVAMPVGDSLSTNTPQPRTLGLCGCCHMPRSKVVKNMTPLIDSVEFTPLQRQYMKRQYLKYLQDIDRQSLFNRKRFTNMRRILMFFSVILTALILIEKSGYVQSNEDVVFAFFIITSSISLLNNFLAAILTDMKLAERAVIFYRGSTTLQSMGNHFLTLTQRYASYNSQTEAFRTFVRDVEGVRILLMNNDVSLLTTEKEEKPEDKHTERRRNWAHIMDPLDAEEAGAMFEGHGAVGKFMRGMAGAVGAMGAMGTAGSVQNDGTPYPSPPRRAPAELMRNLMNPEATVRDMVRGTVDDVVDDVVDNVVDNVVDHAADATAGVLTDAMTGVVGAVAGVAPAIAEAAEAVADAAEAVEEGADAMRDTHEAHEVRHETESGDGNEAESGTEEGIESEGESGVESRRWG